MICSDCGKVHTLPTYYTSYQIYRKTKSAKEMTSNKGKVAICKSFKKTKSRAMKLEKE